MILQPAAPGDFPAIRDLTDRAFATYRQNMAPGRTDWPMDWLRDAVARGDVHWLQDGDGMRPGTVMLSHTGTTLKIEQIAIDPDRQGAGLGARALAAVEAHAQALGATEVTLHTGQQFTRLVAFYSRAGYRVHAVGPHPKGRDDRLRVFMVKSLF